MSHTPQTPHDPGSPPGDRDALRRELRERSVEEFPKECNGLDALLKTISARGPKGHTEALRQAAHRVAAIAGKVGFPKVSDRGAELEMTAAQADRGFSVAVARGQIEALREAFAHEVASPPAWAIPSPEVASPALVHILVAIEADARQVVTDYLQLAGYRPVVVSTGDEVIEAARQHQPGAILLEADLPGVDARSLCRQLKSDPDLGTIPVVLVAAGSSLDDELARQSAGADDYLLEPIDPRELLLRIDMVLRRPRGRG